MIDHNLYSYQKPTSICCEINNEEIHRLKLSDHDFSEVWMKEIENVITDSNYIFRLAENRDLVPLFDFIKSYARPGELEEVSTYDMYRFINYGYGLVIENSEHEIVGTIFEIGYDNSERVSYSIRLVIHPSAGGHNFGQLLSEYTCLLALRRGSKVKTGIIDWDNAISIHIYVNKIGWILYDYFTDLPGIGTCFKTMTPLTKDSLLRNRIDENKVRSFIKNSQIDQDYKIVPLSDKKTMANVFRDTNFKGVALLRPQKQDVDEYSILLLPGDSIKYREL
jgi:hypothetical protein